MSEKINKDRVHSGEHNISNKVTAHFQSLINFNKSPTIPHHPLSKEEEIEGELLFDELSISSDEAHHEKLNERSERKSEKVETFQERFKSILKNTMDEKNNSKKQVTFDIKANENSVNNNYIVIEGGRKWNEKLKNQKKGKFDPTEKRHLMQSLGQELSISNLKLEEVVQAMTEDDEKIPRNLHFWSKVCSVLPDRSLSSSYKFLKRELNTKNKRGEWTAEEIEKLESLIHTTGHKWAKIAKEMNRTAENVRDKFRTMKEEKNDPSLEQTIWKFEELVSFLKYLQKYSKVGFLNEKIEEELSKSEEHNLTEINELKKRKYNSKTFNFHINSVARKYINKDFHSIQTESVNWQKISDKLGTKTIFDCRNKFVQLLQLEFHGLGTKEQVEKEIFLFVSSLKPKEENSIDWKKWTSQQVSIEDAKNRWMILKRHIQGRGQKSFPELLAIMKNRFAPA